MAEQITLAETKQLMTGGVNWFWMVSLRNRFRPKYFVETGVGGGHTIRNAAVLFKHVWSIEIDDGRVSAAKKHCAGIDNVTVIEGDSATVLPDLCKEFPPEDGILFYLDAHWCGGRRVGSTECPLLSELRSILDRPNDVIVIDNAGYMLNPPPNPHKANEWPTSDDIVNLIRSDYPSKTVELAFDQFIISNEPIITTLYRQDT